MNISFKWIGGATFILTIDEIKIAVDPVLCPKGTIQDYFWFKSKRLEEPIYTKNDFKNIDLWLITHNHEDHLDEIGLIHMSEKSKIISNKNAIKKLSKKLFKNHTVLKWGDTKNLQIKDYHIEITAIPAIHGVNPLSAFFAGKVNGYYISISKNDENYNLYITSDTVYKTKIINKLQGKKIDLLLPNMGAAKQGSWIMTLTLNSKMLKKMLKELSPNLVIPIHFGTFEHYKESVDEIIKIDDRRINILKVGHKIMI
jgi:L-ascorbate metabolism protein UlaG (beta-lactamase superfamily)